MALDPTEQGGCISPDALSPSLLLNPPMTAELSSDLVKPLAAT